jgi:peptidoglycan L-alanyl-D-glutamate endopeptidase CwlK
MATLMVGSKGADVRKVQRRLAEVGFSPGDIDGKFGSGTEAAVMAFQAANGLLVDGKVGTRTLEKLFADVAPPVTAEWPDILAHVTPAVVSRMFPLTNIGHIKANLPFVLDGLKTQDLTDRPMALMALATIRAETESFRPIDEGISRFNTSPNGPPFDLYDFRADLGNNGVGEGARYKGRGFVQLTGRSNYRAIGADLALPLEAEPDLANDPANAGRILARFLGRKEREIKAALVDGDLRAARRLVNGGSHGLDRFTDAYERGLALIPEA